MNTHATTEEAHAVTSTSRMVSEAEHPRREGDEVLMRLLALDLGLHCGWALFEGERRIASGVWHLGKDKTRDRGDEFLLRVQSFVSSHGVAVVAHEHVAALLQHVSADAAHLFGGWLTLLAMTARRTGARLHRVETPAVYRASGVKRATAREFRDKAKRREENKRRVVEAARRRGWEVADDNEADACFVALAALAEREGR